MENRYRGDACISSEINSLLQETKAKTQAKDEYKDIVVDNGGKISGSGHTKEGGVIDGRWSFVVGFASFMAQAFLGGIVYTGGIYYTVFTEQFPDTSKVAISWMCNMPLTLWCIASMLGSVITNKYGCRTAALLGGLLTSFGLSLCFVTSNFYMVFMFYGVLTGLGNGIQYIGFVTAVSRYFKRYRAIINVFSSMGPTFGMAVYSFLVPGLIHLFGWHGSLLVIGGVSLNVCAFACALFPFNDNSQNESGGCFNYSILKEKYFLLFCCLCFVCNLSISMAILHLPSLIISFHLGLFISSLSLTVYGIANCIAKIIYGITGHVFNINVGLVFAVSIVLNAMSMALVPLTNNAVWVLCCVGLIGFTYNVTGGLSLEVVLELVDHDHFSDGVGLTQLFYGAGTLLAGPLAGILSVASGNYEMTFFVSGVLSIVGGCLMIIGVCVRGRTTRDRQTDRKTVIITVSDQEPECEKETLEME